MPPPEAASTPPVAARRSTEPKVLRLGDCQINTATRALRRRNQPVPVRRQVFDLLVLLLLRRPDTVGLDELRQAVWGREQVAASAVARAVLEARRAIGDTCPAARLIVNVHGVGYRFAGQLDEGPGAAIEPAAPPDRIDALLREAENAYNLRADAQGARYHAEMALAEALREGRKVASGRALCWLAWLAMWAGSIEEATRHAQHALQIAHSEQHAELQACARTVEAFLQISLGDLDRAATLLNQAHPVLVQAGISGDRYRCENLLSAVATQLGNLEAARQWCREAQQTASAAGLPLAVLRAQSNEVSIGIELGEASQRAGRTDEARQTWQQALQICQELQTRFDPWPDRWLQASCYGNQAVLLGKLGQFGQAREQMCRLEALLADFGQPDAPAVLERSAMLRLLRVQICVDEGDTARAMHEALAALSPANRQLPGGLWHPELLELASRVAESCGRLDLALQWSREHHAAQLALEGQRSRRQTQSMQAQSQQAALTAELADARRTIHFLEQMNAELLQRLSAGSEATAPRAARPS